MPAKELSRIIQSLSLAMLLIAPAISYGHGYIVDSRSHLCKLGQNSGCGSVVYEPQSVEGPDRFPESGPPDGQIASAGLGRFSQLNDQTPTRWKKNDMDSGPNEFVWQFTAVHYTRDFRYFITRPGWNPSEPLTRDSFDLTPFCSNPGGHPPNPLVHNCDVPSRSGYHIILGVWDVGDTSNSFYSVVDAHFSGVNPPDSEWSDVGDIQPNMDLQLGDRVFTRVFDASGEIADSSMQTSLLIENEADGAKLVWPYLLAQKINQTQTSIQAGLLSSGHVY